MESLKTEKAGWLLKLGNSKIKQWRKRWIKVGEIENHIVYRANKNEEPLGKINLMTASVKPSTTYIKSYCFEIITINRTYYFIAPSKEEFDLWIEIISNGIKQAIEQLSPTKKKNTDHLNKISVHEKSSSWSDVRTPSTETGIIYFLSESGVFEKKYIEVKCDSLHLFSSKEESINTKDSVAPILLTLCKIKLPKNQETDEPIFSLVTPTSTMTFKCLSQNEVTHWINFFMRINKYNTNKLRNQKKEKEKNTDDSSSIEESKRIISISNIEGNNICAECSSKDSTWASINLGIFICLECSGIHRSLGVHISKVRSVELDIWSKEIVDFMESMGNIKSNEEWEYLKDKALKKKPSESSSRAEKEDFIRSKYIEKIFCKGNDDDNVENSVKKRKHAFTLSKPQIFNEGWLKLKVNEAWKIYWFVLEGNDLIYYKQRENPNYKGIISLENSQIGYSTANDILNSFEIITKEKIYKLQADDSSNYYNWTDSIRALIDILKIKAEKGGCTNKSVNLDILHQGWLYKEGGSVKSWKKRWFILKKNKLSYYSDTECKDLKGSIALSIATIKEASLYDIKSKKVPDERYSWFFEIVVAKRVYLISASSENERNEWINAIKKSKQDYINLINNSKNYVDYYKKMNSVK